MTSFSAFSNPLSGSGFPSDGVPGAAAWRALLALAVVLALLATTGWTAIREQEGARGPLATAELAWEKSSIAGRKLPGVDAPAHGVRSFFHSLTGAQQHRLADRYPLVVGNLSGAPVQLRYEANRDSLGQARDLARDRAADSRLTDDGRHSAERRLHRFESMLKPGRQFLAFDPTGAGRAAEVFGDLDAAERVSVVVPGVDTELVTFERTERPQSAPAGMAKALQEQQRKTAPGVRTATVAWADYSTPEGLGVEAASGGMAQAGADRLARFVRGLPGSSQTSLFCHSYGSVVCGVAAEDLSPRVTDIAVTGSPGMRADRAADLGTDARVWAGRDKEDWIADVPHMEFGGLGHGADPVSPAFGARLFSAEDANAHTGYFVPGTESLRNFAAIGVGSAQAVSCATTDPGCTVGAE